jgi:hypothetical protein
MKAPRFDVDWSKYSEIPFVVLIHSSRLGWVEMSRPENLEAAWSAYRAADAKDKYLLNFGNILGGKLPFKS